MLEARGIGALGVGIGLRRRCDQPKVGIVTVSVTSSSKLYGVYLGVEFLL